MIKLSFQISNPIGKENFKSYWSWTKSFSDHKHLEMQLYRYKAYLLEVELDLHWRGFDHAGPELNLGLFGYNLRMKLYDSRHWDYDTNQWVKYQE